MQWTYEKISSMSHAERHNLWENAQRLHNADLIKLIEESGLSYRDATGLKLDSGIGRAMGRIVNSAQGVAAGKEATEQGLPALAGIDPLIRAAFGAEYENTFEATIQAGYLVALMMRKQGYRNSGRQGRLQGCVAMTGEIYIPE